MLADLARRRAELEARLSALTDEWQFPERLINIHHSFLPAFAARTPTGPRTTAA